MWDDFVVTPPLAAVPDLERELDELYGRPLASCSMSYVISRITRLQDVRG